MKLINNNIYKIMYGEEFLIPDEVKEVTDKKIIEILLKQPNVKEYVDKKDVEKLEEENKKLKEKLDKKESTSTKNKKNSSTKS